MKKFFDKCLKKSERGATMVEYALIVALISIVAVAAMTNIGTGSNNKLSTAASALK